MPKSPHQTPGAAARIARGADVDADTSHAPKPASQSLLGYGVLVLAILASIGALYFGKEVILPLMLEQIPIRLSHILLRRRSWRILAA
jgi:hypothetical protein